MAEEHDTWMNKALGVNTKDWVKGGAVKGNSAITAKPAPPSKEEIKAPPNPVTDIVRRIAQNLADEHDIGDDIQALKDLDMSQMLEALTQLRRTGYFEGLRGYAPKFGTRLGAAFYTVDENYGTEWQALLAKLGDNERAVILARVPEGSRPESGSGKPGQKTDNQPDKNVGWQGQASAALQYAVHYTIKRGAISKSAAPNDLTIQTSLAGNYVGHKDKASGPEFQAFYQFGYNETNGQISNVVGVQGALVKVLWDKLWQLQGFVQAVAGVASSGKVNSGTFQAQIGVQLLRTVGSVQIGIQGSGGATYTDGSPIDLPAGVSLVIQGNF
jgi:hypothetical protein